jgi:hypothetical protein
MGILCDAAKNTNNYLSPIAGIDHRERSAIDPIICNTANYTLERRKIHNRNKSENFGLFRGNSVNHEKYLELKKINVNSLCGNSNIHSIGFPSHIQSPIFHRRNASNISEAYNNNNEISFTNDKRFVNSSIINNNANKGENLDIKNNLFNIKTRRLEQKKLYDPKYNEK